MTISTTPRYTFRLEHISKVNMDNPLAHQDISRFASLDEFLAGLANHTTDRTIHLFANPS